MSPQTLAIRASIARSWPRCVNLAGRVRHRRRASDDPVTRRMRSRSRLQERPDIRRPRMPGVGSSRCFRLAII